jgi:xanthine dehydrogenase YagS FAD-binding subunit
VSVAAALDLDDGPGAQRAARPGRRGAQALARAEAGAVLAGKPATAANFEAAAEVLLRGARGQGDNAFKFPLARRAIVRALETATSGTQAHARDPNDGPGRPDIKEQQP